MDLQLVVVLALAEWFVFLVLVLVRVLPVFPVFQLYVLATIQLMAQRFRQKTALAVGMALEAVAEEQVGLEEVLPRSSVLQVGQVAAVA